MFCGRLVSSRNVRCGCFLNSASASARSFGSALLSQKSESELTKTNQGSVRPKAKAQAALRLILRRVARQDFTSRRGACGPQLGASFVPLGA